MTSVAFILGCVPLAIATGASANSRISIGTGVIGGMLAATVIAVFWIPMFYYVIETLGERVGGRRKAKPPPPAPELVGPQQPSAGAGAGHMPRARPPGE
jgi:multidrug efflux pump